MGVKPEALAGGDINSAGQSARLVAQENATRLIVSIGRIALRLKRTLDKQGRITVQDILDSPYAELADFITDVQTLVDPESSRVEKGLAVLNIATGINRQTVEGASRIIAKAGKIGKKGKQFDLSKLSKTDRKSYKSLLKRLTEHKENYPHIKKIHISLIIKVC